MRKPLAIALIAVTVMAATSTAQASTTQATQTQTIHQLRTGIRWQRSQTWHWQDVAGKPRTATRHREQTSSSVLFLRWIDRLWMRRRLSAKHSAAATSPTRNSSLHYALWICIHHGEAGTWNANTGNGYLGGLQMTPDWGGVARPDLLSASQQMGLAERGYRASGYSRAWLEGQWPNTSPPCLGYA